MIAAAPAAEAAADSLANTQAFSGLAGLSETGQIGLAGLIGGAGFQLATQGAALNGLAALGLFGPTYGVTPQNAATNVGYAYLVNSLLGQLSAVGASQAFLALGSSAMLANSGRRFLLSTYYGI